MKKTSKKTEIFELDARNQSFGRLASKIAFLLQGKHRTDYAPNLDISVTVKILNIKEIKITGKKETKKVYRHYSGYPGGMKEVRLDQYLKSRPQVILYKAVYNMLPPNRLRAHRMTRLLFI
ncbi:MAG: 50S ribosomal protein L13 [Patescibacteria group bacterium]|nr:50S ribosomal protein L13 [Patescibacteria group bacterium]